MCVKNFYEILLTRINYYIFLFLYLSMKDGSFKRLFPLRNQKTTDTMKKLFTMGIAAAILTLSLLGGCAKTEETFHYVNLSQVACSFLGEGNQPLEITVRTSPAAYEATPDATWVKVEKSEDGKILTLTVDDNDTGAERLSLIHI